MARALSLQSVGTRDRNLGREDYFHRIATRQSENRALADRLDEELSIHNLATRSFQLYLPNAFTLRRETSANTEGLYTTIYRMMPNGQPTIPLYERRGNEQPIIMPNTLFDEAIAPLLNGWYFINPEFLSVSSLTPREIMLPKKYSTK